MPYRLFLLANLVNYFFHLTSFVPLIVQKIGDLIQSTNEKKGTFIATNSVTNIMMDADISSITDGTDSTHFLSIVDYGAILNIIHSDLVQSFFIP